MTLIKNFDQLATSPERKIVLELVDAALSAIQPEEVMKKDVLLEGSTLTIAGKTFNLDSYENVYLVGFGKGSALMSKLIEEKLGDRLTEGYVVDVTEEQFSKIQFTMGTHPLPSEQNYEFTKKVVERFSGKLSEKDLVLVVICGGGSAMFVLPKIGLPKLIETNKALLKSGADIYQMNTVRKHVSDVKGGQFAQKLYPATVASLIFSDVPGNDLSVIASGTTVKDATSIDDAWKLVQDFSLPLTREELSETPKEDQYFQNVSNLLVLSNITAISAMQKKAEELGQKTTVYSDHIKEEAGLAAQDLLSHARPNEILLAGGETTVKVTTKGVGGRNQHLVLSAVSNLPEDVILCSFDSDGWDNTSHAGALADTQTQKKVEELNLKPEEFLTANSSFDFFEKVGDSIITDRLASNVSDLMIVLKK